MATALDDPAAVQVEDVVGTLDRRDPVRDQEDGASPAARTAGLRPRRKIGHHAVFGCGVEGGGRFVEHEDGRIAHYRTGDGEPLPLAGGELAAAVGEDGVETVRQAVDVVVHAGHPDGLEDLGIVGIRRARHGVADVVPHRHREQHVLLQRDGDVVAHGVDLVVAQVPAVDGDRAGIRVVEPQQQRHQRALAGAGGADDRRDGAGLGGEAHRIENRTVGLVGEPHVVVADLVAERRHGHGVGLVLGRRARCRGCRRRAAGPSPCPARSASCAGWRGCRWSPPRTAPWSS